MDRHFRPGDGSIPLTMIVEAVLGRALSALKDERVAASRSLTGPKARIAGERKAFIETWNRRSTPQADLLHPGLHADARRGAGAWLEPQLRRDRAHVAGRMHHPVGFSWEDQGSVRPEPQLANLLLDPLLQKQIESAQEAWRRVVAKAVRGDSGAGHVQRARLL